MSPRIFTGIFFLGLFLLTSFFATYVLTESPKVWYDEGYYLQLALNQERFGAMGLQVAPGEFVSAATVSLGFPLVYPVAFSFTHFGVGILQARVVMVVFMLAFFLCASALVYRLFGARAALLSAALIATFPIFYGDGKNMLGEVPGMFYFFAFLISLGKIEADRFSGTFYYILAGFFAGLAVTTKPIFLLILPACIAVAVLYRRRIRWRWGALAMGVAVFLSSGAFWLVTQFSLADSVSDTFSHYANPYGIIDIAHTIVTNVVGLFTAATPLHFVGLMLIWVLGIAVRVRRGVAISLSEAIAFVFALCISLAYVRTAGWYRYFFPAHLVALVFAAPALLICAEYVRDVFASRTWAKFLVPVGVALIGFLSLYQLFQLSFDSWVANSYRSTTTASLERVVGSIDPSLAVFLYNVPEIAVFLPSQNYYQYLRPTEFIETGRDQLPRLSDGSIDIVIIASEEISSVDSAAYYEIGRVADYAILGHQGRLINTTRL